MEEMLAIEIAKTVVEDQVYELPYHVEGSADPLIDMIYLKDKAGREVCAFYGTGSESRKAARLIRDLVNTAHGELVHKQSEPAVYEAPF